MNENRQKTILVLGATGKIGGAVVTAFAKAGWQVIAQVRPKHDVTTFTKRHNVTWLTCALDDKSLLDTHVDAVFYGLNPSQYTDKAWQKEAIPMLKQGIAITKAHHARMLFPGNVYVYGKDLPTLIDEGTPQKAETVKGNIRIEMEKLIEHATQLGEMTATIIRAGDYWGDGDHTVFTFCIARKLDKHIVTMLGEPSISTPFAYLPDFAETFVAIAARADALKFFDTFHFKGHQLAHEDWHAALTKYVQDEKGYDGELKTARFSWRLFSVLRLVIPIVKSIYEMRYLWLNAHELDNRKLIALIGEEPHTPMQIALARTVSNMQ